jgi:transposase-like protein
MARKSQAEPERQTRKRLTPDQKQEIAAALARGEAGNAIAERMGISAATVYAQRRKQTTDAAAGGASGGDSQLKTRLVSFAVRTLLGQAIPAEERSELEGAVREELVRRVAAGI